MAHQYTEAENKIWFESLPKKIIGVKVIIKSTVGNILLVKPNYKPTWQFPGGGVETQEDPKEAAIRELKEEIGIEINLKDLKLLDTVFINENDSLLLIFEYQIKLSEEIQLNYQKEELDGYEFFSIQDVKPKLSKYYGEFWDRYVG